MYETVESMHGYKAIVPKFKKQRPPKLGREKKSKLSPEARALSTVYQRRGSHMYA